MQLNQKYKKQIMNTMDTCFAHLFIKDNGVNSNSTIEIVVDNAKTHHHHSIQPRKSACNPFLLTATCASSSTSKRTKQRRDSPIPLSCRWQSHPRTKAQVNRDCLSGKIPLRRGSLDCSVATIDVGKQQQVVEEERSPKKQQYQAVDYDDMPPLMLMTEGMIMAEEEFDDDDDNDEDSVECDDICSSKIFLPPQKTKTIISPGRRRDSTPKPPSRFCQRKEAANAA